MRFALIDGIVELVPRERIVAVKAVSLAEEYLADHFPTFPVLPGVLILEAMAEAAAYLVYQAEDFASSVILLRRAKNVTYKGFVKPGRLLRVEIACRRLARGESDFAGAGFCDDQEVVKARFSLVHYNLKDRDPALEPLDREIQATARKRFAFLRESTPDLMRKEL
ncbi:MAG: beta-hydroxyacyl-ACP dehydratase [Phycisphaerales bacterium]|nr:MAG: beta-hydroxyacyl-ACP dehydratase [Phycisphaerales bacterium]